jgi:hypothetical protein
MAREHRAIWAARVARWTRSGLSGAAFAAREGVNPRTLTYWRWRLRTAGPSPVPARRDAAFVELVVPPAAREAVAPLEIVLPAGYRVRLAAAIVPETLRTVLDVLEARG